MFSFDTVSKDLDATIYAAHVRGILLYHIFVLQKAVSYGKLARSTGDMPSGGQLAQALARIAEHDHNAGKTLSTAIVVREDTRIPGSGFFNQCRKLGYDILEDPAAEMLFWRESMNKLGVDTSFDSVDPLSVILKRDVPSSEEIKVLSSMWRTHETETLEKSGSPDIGGVTTPPLDPMDDVKFELDSQSIRGDFWCAFSKIKTKDKQEKLRVGFLGKNGRVADLMRDLKDLSDKQKGGMIINALCAEIRTALHIDQDSKTRSFSENVKKMVDRDLQGTGNSDDVHVCPEIRAHDANLVATQNEQILIPATRLEKGDVVHLPDHVSSFRVESVTRDLGDPVVRWSSMGRNFETEHNSHIRIDTPERLKKPANTSLRRIVTTRLVP